MSICISLSISMYTNIYVHIYTHTHTNTETQTSDYESRSKYTRSVYGVATMSRMLKNTGLFAEYRSLL